MDSDEPSTKGHVRFDRLPSGAGPINLEQLGNKAGLNVKSLEAHRVVEGFRLARGVLLLIMGVLVLIGLFALLTAPHLQDTATLEVASAQRFDAYQTLRNDWFNSIKDLLQLLVVSLLVPLLATLVGFIFGRRTIAGHDATDDD